MLDIIDEHLHAFDRNVCWKSKSTFTKRSVCGRNKANKLCGRPPQYAPAPYDFDL